MIANIGLGLKRDFVEALLSANKQPLLDGTLPDFVEVAPENWIGQGAYSDKLLSKITKRFPLICHGLSLSLGGIKPIDVAFVKQVKQFMTQFNVQLYSEHLSYSDDGGQLYDLLPLPMTMEAVRYVSSRIQQVQDILGQRLVIENVSTYVTPHSDMSEAAFMCEVLQRTDCSLLLDVNNVYVNYFNHPQADTAFDFISQMPSDKISYVHIAGHMHYTPQATSDSDSLPAPFLIDTHGANVCKDVWQLLQYTYQVHGIKPTLLERDFNIPPLDALLLELNHIKQQQTQYLQQSEAT